MNWKLKSALRHSVLALPGGAALYRHLTTRVLGTQHGMAAKWFRVFPAHVRVMKEKFGPEARMIPMWCFDSGATAAAGFANALVSDVPGLLTDRWDRLTNRYLETSRKILAEKGAELAALANAPAGHHAAVMAKAAVATDCRSALAGLGISYASRHEEAVSDMWLGKIGIVYSAGTFEHYTPEQVDATLEIMSKALRPGGVLSHVVDHRDHRWHADKSIPPFLHLTLDETSYQKQFGNPLDYHNRWMQSRWVEAFKKHGFEVECKAIFRYDNTPVPLDRSSLAPPFHNLPDEDLDVLVTHFVATKRG